MRSLIGDLTGGSGLSKALAGVTLAGAGMAVALGVEAVKKASDFQNAMKQNVAHAGLAQQQFDAVSQSVLAMATDVGQMPTDLAQGLYPILSGFSGITDQAAKAQSSLAALKLAAEDVAGTETKTTVTSGALIAAFNALGLQTNNAATNIARLKTLNDQMEATVIAGNMHWQDYANVVGKLATAIKGTGVSFQEASAGLATMTNEGFSAQRSQTYLANLFTQIGIKTDALAKNAAKLGGSYTYVTSTSKQLYDATHHLDGKLVFIAGHMETLYKTHTAQLGIGFDETKFKAMDLADKIAYLTQITHGNQQELLKLLGGNATALKTFNALSTSLKTYQTNLEAIRNSQGDTQKAFDVASSSFQMAGQRMKAAIDVLLIDLGTQLLPILTKVLDWVTPLIKQFANWVLTNQSLHQWLSNVGGFLTNSFFPAVLKIGQAVASFVGWMQQASPAAQVLQGMLLSVGAAILALKIKDIGVQFASTLNDAAGNVAAFGQKLLGLGTPISTVDAEITGMGAITDETEATVGAASAGMGASFLGILGPIAAVFAGIVQLRNAIGGMSLPGSGGMTVDQQAQAMRNVTHGLAGGPFFGTGQGPSSSSPSPNSEPMPFPRPMFPGVPHAASGGAVLQSGLAVIHQGEHITPAGQGGIIINVNTMAGSRSEIQRMVDLIEAELAQRFRSQTGNYATGGTF